MAVAKITKSGNGVLFIDDQGNVYCTSKIFMEGLLSGKSPNGFILLTQMPNKVSTKRFKCSPLWDPGSKGRVEATSANDDSLSNKVLGEKEDSKNFIDKEVW